MTVAIREKIYNFLLEVVDTSVLPPLVDCLILPGKRYLHIQWYKSVMGTKTMRLVDCVQTLRSGTTSKTEDRNGDIRSIRDMTEADEADPISSFRNLLYVGCVKLGRSQVRAAMMRHAAFRKTGGVL